MRAVARGIVLETLPLCPERCGGPGASVDSLSEDVRRHRTRHGCDVDIPDGDPCHYAIRCPSCDGAAKASGYCPRCSDGDFPGYVSMRRCPASHMTSDIGEAMTAMRWLKDGVLPTGSSLADQTASFVAFRAIFEAESNEAREEVQKD